MGDRSNFVNQPRFKGGWSNAPARVHPSNVKFANNHDAASLNNSTQGQILRPSPKVNSGDVRNDVMQRKPTVRCFNSEQPGHLSRDCTQTRMEAKFSYCGHFSHKGFQCKIRGQVGKPKEAGLSITRVDRLNHPVDVKS